jgi:hypothetical protein
MAISTRKDANAETSPADRSEVRNFNSPIRIEEDVARLHRPVQKSEAVRKPKCERNPHNRFRPRHRRPSRGRIPKKRRVLLNLQQMNRNG